MGAVVCVVVSADSMPLSIDAGILIPGIWFETDGIFSKYDSNWFDLTHCKLPCGRACLRRLACRYLTIRRK